MFTWRAGECHGQNYKRGHLFNVWKETEAFSKLRHVGTLCFHWRPDLKSTARGLEFFQISPDRQKCLTYSDVCFNKTHAVLCENGTSGLNRDSVWVIWNIITSNKTILNETLPFARPSQPHCVQQEVDRSISSFSETLLPVMNVASVFLQLKQTRNSLLSGYYFSWQCGFFFF